MVELVFSALKTPISLQKRQYSIMLQRNLMKQTWYMILQWHIQITERHVIQELETYGYTRKGGIGDTRKV